MIAVDIGGSHTVAFFEGARRRIMARGLAKVRRQAIQDDRQAQRPQRVQQPEAADLDDSDQAPIEHRSNRSIDLINREWLDRPENYLKSKRALVLFIIYFSFCVNAILQLYPEHFGEGYLPIIVFSVLTMCKMIHSWTEGESIGEYLQFLPYYLAWIFGYALLLQILHAALEYDFKHTDLFSIIVATVVMSLGSRCLMYYFHENCAYIALRAAGVFCGWFAFLWTVTSPAWEVLVAAYAMFTFTYAHAVIDADLKFIISLLKRFRLLKRSTLQEENVGAFLEAIAQPIFIMFFQRMALGVPMTGVFFDPFHPWIKHFEYAVPFIIQCLLFGQSLGHLFHDYPLPT